MCTWVVAVTFRSEQKCLSTWCKRCARCLRALRVKHTYEGFDLVNNNLAGGVLTAPGGEEGKEPPHLLQLLHTHKAFQDWAREHQA